MAPPKATVAVFPRGEASAGPGSPSEGGRLQAGLSGPRAVVSACPPPPPPSHQGQEGVWPEVMLAEGPERTDRPGQRVGGAPSAGPPGLACPPPSWRHLLGSSWGPGMEQRHVRPPGGGLGLGAGWGGWGERGAARRGGSRTEHHGPCGGPHSEEGGSEPRGSLAEETRGRVWGGRAAKLGGAGGIPSDLPQGSGGLRGLTDVGKHFAARLVQSQSPENKGS